MGWFKKRKSEASDIDNSEYGAFMLSKNVFEKKRPIRYTYREEASIPVMNGWHIYADIDDDEYVSNPENFTLVGATTISEIAPVILEIFDAPYGTDLFWVYEEGVHTGFVDVTTNKGITIAEILAGKGVHKDRF